MRDPTVEEALSYLMANNIIGSSESLSARADDKRPLSKSDFDKRTLSRVEVATICVVNVSNIVTDSFKFEMMFRLLGLHEISEGGESEIWHSNASRIFLSSH